MFLGINGVDFLFTINGSKHRFSPEIKSGKIYIGDNMEIFRFKARTAVIPKLVRRNFTASLTSIPIKILACNDDFYRIKFKVISLVCSWSKEIVLYTVQKLFHLFIIKPSHIFYDLNELFINGSSEISVKTKGLDLTSPRKVSSDIILNSITKSRTSVHDIPEKQD